MIKDKRARNCEIRFLNPMDRLGAAFEAELVTIIGPLAAKHSNTDLSPAQLAHILVSAAASFEKVTADAIVALADPCATSRSSSSK